MPTRGCPGAMPVSEPCPFLSRARKGAVASRCDRAATVRERFCVGSEPLFLSRERQGAVASRCDRAATKASGLAAATRALLLHCRRTGRDGRGRRGRRRAGFGRAEIVRVELHGGLLPQRADGLRGGLIKGMERERL